MKIAILVIIILALRNQIVDGNKNLIAVFRALDFAVVLELTAERE